MAKVKVVEKTQIADSISVLKLAPLEGAVTDWLPGSHIDLYLPDGMIRSYSLVPSDDGCYEIAVLKETESRGGSLYIHDMLAVGDQFEISAPKSMFEIQKQGSALLFAAGIGITPMLSIADELARSGVAFEFHYCIHTREEAAYLDQLSNRPWADSCKLHISSEHSRLDLGVTLASRSMDEEVYACGPSRFLTEIESVMTDQNALSQLHVEYFASDELDSSGDGFQVLLAKSDQKIDVAEGQSILDAMRDSGLDPVYACEVGVCGTCVVPLLEGEVDHRDMFLTEDEREANREIAICCSRAKGKHLVIDL
jgi:vanillate O-demethylase ferredoxin subunit